MSPAQLRKLAKALSHGHYSMSEAIDALEKAADKIERLLAARKQKRSKL
jgi:hypothetical protein